MREHSKCCNIIYLILANTTTCNGNSEKKDLANYRRKRQYNLEIMETKNKSRTTMANMTKISS
jgi:hypothetical protein